MVYIDTVTLCGNTQDDQVYDQPQGPIDQDFANEQWDFIDKSLAASKSVLLDTKMDVLVF